MSFAYPELLWGFLLLPFLAFLFVLNLRRGARDLEKLAGEWRGLRFLRAFYLKSLVAGVGQLGFFVFGLLALSGLSWGLEGREERSVALDLALVLDVSQSMEARDPVSTRREQALSLARPLLDNLPGTRFSLIYFKGEALTAAPLTEDLTAVGQLLEQAGPAWITAPGSNLERALDRAWRSFSFASGRHRALVVFSDGENLSGQPLAAARRIARAGGRVYTVTVGRPEGVALSRPDGSALRGPDGQAVTSRPRPDLMEALASEGRGRAFRADEGPGALLGTLQALADPGPLARVRFEARDQYPLLGVLALVFLIMGLVTRVIPWKKLF